MSESGTVKESLTVEPADDVVDEHLDRVLRASGSALRNYTLPGTLEKMRSAMRAAMRVVK